MKTLKPKLGKKTGFRNFLEKMKRTFNSTLRKRKRIKLTRKGNTTLVAAEWVDQELIDSIKLRSRWSREWRRVRKRKETDEVIKACRDRYLEQKKITAKMTARKKGEWEKKIEETKKDGKRFWEMIIELLGENNEREEET